MHVGTWNVAGIGEAVLGSFVEQLSDNFPWDVLFLQEAFCRTEGIDVEFNHYLFTSGTRAGGLRCPAILVNERWGDVHFITSGARWLAVGMGPSVILISLHLPDIGHDLVEFSACLGEMEQALANMGGRTIYIGMDANTHVHSVVDHLHVGEGVTHRQHSPEESERANLLHDFLCRHGLYLANKFACM